MTIPYDDGLSRDFGVGVNQANADYVALHGTDIPYDPGMISVMSQRAAWDYYDGNLSWNDSKTKHLNEYRDQYGLPHVGPGPVGPFVPAPSEYWGNMCGMQVPNMPPVDGGASDASLILSWFYDRYDDAHRTILRAEWKRRGQFDVLTSWPDARDFGHSPEEFLQFQQELIADGLRPCVMLSAKPTSAVNIQSVEGTLRNIMLVLPLLVGVVPRFCVGWELSLWLSPSDVQWLTEQIAPYCRQQVGTQVWVHFQEGYMSFPLPDHDNASYWVKQVGLLDGVLVQAHQYDPEPTIMDWIHDCLVRFAGQFNMPTDRGDGRPFSFVLLELSAMLAYNNAMSEGEQNRRGHKFVTAPSESGPAGVVHVMGTGNGF